MTSYTQKNKTPPKLVETKMCKLGKKKIASCCGRTCEAKRVGNNEEVFGGLRGVLQESS